MAQKLTEKTLYATYLDIWYACEINDDLVLDLTEQLKMVKKQAAKSKRLLKKAAEHYEKINGSKPRTPK